MPLRADNTCTILYAIRMIKYVSAVKPLPIPHTRIDLWLPRSIIALFPSFGSVIGRLPMKIRKDGPTNTDNSVTLYW